jgi:hypothetical protein
MIQKQFGKGKMKQIQKFKKKNNNNKLVKQKGEKKHQNCCHGSGGKK